ncbi:hypothetical protein Q31a_05620 [Aureliella helgolandensis]|uniref:Uncharacterized protein n=1 Tax=Aureliella helgolandensis TaxID=2527968 RepID=A0A518G0Z5_9BACT|nr:hypothetical protein Q31a_05620 [Aureliella helgolandensis]
MRFSRNLGAVPPPQLLWGRSLQLRSLSFAQTASCHSASLRAGMGIGRYRGDWWAPFAGNPEIVPKIISR